MELKDYVRLLRRRWWLLLLGMLLGGLGGYVATERQPEVYGSGLTFFLADASGRPVSADVATAASSRLSSYVTLVSSTPVRSQVAEEAGTQNFSAFAAPLTGTIFLRVEVTAASAADAFAVAQAYEQVLPEFLSDFEGGPTSEGSITLGSLEPPQQNDIRLGPNSRRNLAVGLMLGLVLASALLVLLESLDDKVREEEDLDRIADVGVVAAVPWEFPGQRLITTHHPRSQRAEALRLIRTNVQFVGVGSSLKTLVVTSAGSDEGKTSVASDLALAYAQAGQRVVLVDGDLRRPRVARLFDVQTEVGLTSALLGETTLEKALIPWTGGGGELLLLPSGPRPEKPSELLASAKMGKLLAELREHHDIIIIDSAPVLPVADTLALLAHVDAVLLVVRTGSTARSTVRAAVDRLHTVEARVVGLVLNGGRTKASRYHQDESRKRIKVSSGDRALRAVPSELVTPAPGMEPGASRAAFRRGPRSSSVRAAGGDGAGSDA